MTPHFISLSTYIHIHYTPLFIVFRPSIHHLSPPRYRRSNTLSSSSSQPQFIDFSLSLSLSIAQQTHDHQLLISQPIPLSVSLIFLIEPPLIEFLQNDLCGAKLCLPRLRKNEKNAFTASGRGFLWERKRKRAQVSRKRK